MSSATAHLLTGQHVVFHMECGNPSCRKWWDQPGVDPANPGWLVCPHCITALSTNVDRAFATALDDKQAA